MSQPIKSPLTLPEIMNNLDEEGYIRGVVEVTLSDIIDRTFDEFLDFISTKLVGNDLLMDIFYTIVGHTGDSIYLEVAGDPKEAIEFARPGGVLDWRPGESPELGGHK